MTLALGAAAHVLVLTGAGISAESGVPTFRDAGGLWEGHRVEDVASPEAFARDPATVWRFYAARRAAMAQVVPNRGHAALVELEARTGDRFLLATQNVDGLHAAAGSRRIVEMHGNLMSSRCASCDRPPFADRQAYASGVVPRCDRCAEHGRDALLRPHIVWFGEMLDPTHLASISRFIKTGARAGQLVFIAVGTSGHVYPAAGLVDEVRRAGGTSWLLNADASANADRFDHVVLGRAGEVLPELLRTV